MLVNFTKMHGLGNDFVVIDQITQYAKLRVPHIKQICDRHTGVGCDQLLLIEPPMNRQTDFYYRIYNANGQEAEQCGNGIRCVSRFFYDMGFTNQTTLQVDCAAGTFSCDIQSSGQVTVNMGKPEFQPKSIPFKASKQQLSYPLTIDHQTVEACVLAIGNPHAIIQTQKVKNAPIETQGPLIGEHVDFPNGANVGFMEVINKGQIRLRVFERGAGETLACGTNACAAVVSGIRLGLLESPCEVLFSKGSLSITWEGEDKPIYMRGPTKSIYTGRFRL